MRPSTSACTGLCALAVACGGGKAEPKKSTSEQRVNAVVAKNDGGESLADFCEIQRGPTDGVVFKLPPLGEGSPAPKTTGAWRWINIWATWCKPCIEELPLIAKWRDRIRDEGIPAGIEFLSVDDDAQLVTKFRSEHPDVPESLRIADADALPTWLVELGLDASAVLPIHLFVDGNDRIRCVRMGGVGARDWDVVKRVLTQK